MRYARRKAREELKGKKNEKLLDKSIQYDGY